MTMSHGLFSSTFIRSPRYIRQQTRTLRRKDTRRKPSVIVRLPDYIPDTLKTRTTPIFTPDPNWKPPHDPQREINKERTRAFLQSERERRQKPVFEQDLPSLIRKGELQTLKDLRSSIANVYELIDRLESVFSNPLSQKDLKAQRKKDVFASYNNPAGPSHWDMMSRGRKRGDGDEQALQRDQGGLVDVASYEIFADSNGEGEFTPMISTALSELAEKLDAFQPLSDVSPVAIQPSPTLSSEVNRPSPILSPEVIQSSSDVFSEAFQPPSGVSPEASQSSFDPSPAVPNPIVSLPKVKLIPHAYRPLFDQAYFGMRRPEAKIEEVPRSETQISQHSIEEVSTTTSDLRRRRRRGSLFKGLPIRHYFGEKSIFRTVQSSRRSDT